MEKDTLKHVIEGYCNWLWYFLYKPYRKKQQKLFSERIQICENCEHFTKTRQCKLCWCFCDAKVKCIYKLDKDGLSIDGCWERKW
jgi:recombinational DNA repair protein RecR